MSFINETIFIARLTKDPELKSTNTGTYLCNIDVAIDQSYTKDGNKVDDVCFITCTAWSKLAELISKYTSKGHLVAIKGQLKMQRWEHEGKKHQKHYVLIEKIQFLQPKSDGQSYKPESVADSFGGEKTDKYTEDFNEPFNDDIAF